MTPEVALQKREQVMRDGYCVVDDILTENFLQELREESERLIAGHEPPPDVRYQGQHVGVRGVDNPIIQKLLDWQPSREALEQMGFGDFESTGGIIILTKDPRRTRALLAPRLDAMERSDELFTVAADHVPVLLLNRYNG